MAEVVSVYPHPGPQTMALQSSAKELLYGGEAGGGKSRFLCLDALRLVEHPSYKGILFRRHTTELADSLIPETEKIYPHLGARWQSAKLKWIFPSGASIRLAHMEHENTKNRYDGGEYQFCVARGTPILLGSGEWKPIEDVVVGDMVATLIGPRRVLKTHRPGVKPVVRLKNRYGEVTVSRSHRLLTADGWIAPKDLGSTFEAAVFCWNRARGVVVHPYSGRAMTSSLVNFEPCSNVPAGSEEVLDLTVEEASHYIVSNGLVAQNCGFDELTHFYESQYLFMFSRLRSAEGLPTYMRATTNPGGMGHEWVLKRFAPWLYPETERAYKGVRAKAGQKLFFRRTPLGVDEACEPKWHDPECKKCHPKKPCAEHKPRSRVFLPAKLTDNPSLGGEYAANLDSLDPITRAWKKFGDWMARPEGGKVFNRENLLPTERRPFMLDRPTQAVARVRFWDRAATDGGGDYTAGVLMSVMANGIFVVEDVIAKQLDPAGVATLIIQTAKSDPPGTIVGLEREPGASGKFEAAFYVRALAGFNVQVIPADANKVVRAGPFATQVDGGNVRLVVGEWNDPYILELHSFPDGKHDDQVDGSSGAFRVLVPLLHAFRESGESISVMAL